MQKKLITLAVIAAAFSAPAFADTSVYGVLDTGFGTMNNTITPSGGGTTSKTGLSGVDFSQMYTTRFGINNTEDLGNGMKVTAVVETNIAGTNPMTDSQWRKIVAGTNATTGGVPTAAGMTVGNASTAPTATALGDRVLDIALNLGQGTTILAGKMSSPLRNIAYGYDAFYGSNLVGNLVTMDADLTARAVAVGVAHNINDVVSVTAAALDNTTTADGAPDVKHGNGYELTATYKKDVLSVSAGYRSLEATTNNTATPIATATDNTTKITLLAASYDFGMAKVYGQYANIQNDDSVAGAANVQGTGKRNYETAGVNVPFTPVFAGWVELSAGSTKWLGQEQLRYRIAAA